MSLEQVNLLPLQEVKRQKRTRLLWEEMFPSEPYDHHQLEGGRVPPRSATTATPPFSYDILAASKRQETFAYQARFLPDPYESSNPLRPLIYTDDQQAELGICSFCVLCRSLVF